MTNNELLLAISDMMDTKLKAELQPLKNEIQDFKSEMRNEMQDFKSEMRNEMLGFKSEMWNEMQDFENGMWSFRDEMCNETQSMKSEIHQIKLFQENILLPRLETIESCYLDTYRRYRDDADRMEAVFEDVDIMKKVITEHSKQLQRLA